MMLPKLGVGLVILFIMLFVFIASDWIYGPYADVVRNSMIVYFILFVMIMASLKEGMPMLGAKLSDIAAFSVGFVITAILVYFIPMKGLAGEINYTALKIAFGFGILHGFIKAYIEESVFRDILLRRIGKYWANGLFGLFHLGMIIMTLTTLKVPITFVSLGVPVMTLTALGFVWTWVRMRTNLMGAVGSHLAYNLKAFGVLQSVIRL